MPVFRTWTRKVLPLLSVLLISACSAISVAAPTKDVSASNLMPNISGYARVDTQDVRGTIANLASGGALLAGNPEISALVKVADRFAGCYQKAGAFQADVFTNTSNPVLSGAILILNQSVAQNPQVFLSCLNPAGASVQDVGGPCTKNYTLTSNGSTYQIFYAATDPQVCQAFCSVLQGCH